MGDKALVLFAHLLHQTFVGDDVVGRWGGRLFIVAMYGLSLDEGKQRLRSLRQQLHEILPSTTVPQSLDFRSGLSIYLPAAPDDPWPAGDHVALITQAMEQLDQNQRGL